MNQRIVVKIGSQVLCDPGGRLILEVLSDLVRQISELSSAGWQVILVSSGAVAAGTEPSRHALENLNDPVVRKQVMAATGQVRLMETYRQLFDRHGHIIAQVLTSKSDFQTRRHYLNMRGCIEGLLANGIVPIVNENDVVSVTELMFTDNDELAGLLAGMVKAQVLCLLSTVPGVYDGDPDDPTTHCIEQWDDEEYAIEDIVRRGTSALGRGGMHSKLEIARKTSRLGTEVVISDGRAEDILARIVSGQSAGTRFPARGETSSAKRWLASADSHASGSVTVNAGAEQALMDKSLLTSLLPVGVEKVTGNFDRGDVVTIINPEGKVLGCGIARFDHYDADEMIGKRGQKALIHYDYLYLVD